MLLAKMQMSAAAFTPDASGGSAGSSWDVCVTEDLDDVGCLQSDTVSGISASGDVELRVARLELLIDRRPLLLSGVLLRQNPHNVAEVCILRNNTSG